MCTTSLLLSPSLGERGNIDSGSSRERLKIAFIQTLKHAS